MPTDINAKIAELERLGVQAAEPCSNCKRSKAICIVNPNKSERCAQCVRKHRSRCTVAVRQAKKGPKSVKAGRKGTAVIAAPDMDVDDEPEPEPTPKRRKVRASVSVVTASVAQNSIQEEREAMDEEANGGLLTVTKSGNKFAKAGQQFQADFQRFAAAHAVIASDLEKVRNERDQAYDENANLEERNQLLIQLINKH